MKYSPSALCLAAAASYVSVGNGFVLPTTSKSTLSSSQLEMGLFDGFKAGGSGRDRLDEEWEKQQAILKQRRAPKSERDDYFMKIEKRRQEASKKQDEMWGWQSKSYKKGEDPLDEWKKRRAAGTISDLDNQYGDPKEIGGIPLPMPSFGVGGEFGVGGKYDNGGRFDLRLPYADQGYVDEDADVMGKISGFFGGNKKKKAEEAAAAAAAAAKKADAEKKKGMWPW
jgi:hypothetical protein